MIIKIEHIPGTYPKFNVHLHSAEGKESFLTVRGCKIADGKNGPFVSWPSSKNEKTEKWWNHVVTSKGFNDLVLAEAMKAPKESPKAVDDDLPF